MQHGAGVLGELGYELLERRRVQHLRAACRPVGKGLEIGYGAGEFQDTAAIERDGHTGAIHQAGEELRIEVPRSDGRQ